LFISSLADYGWYVTRLHPDSFRPTPASRSVSQFMKKNETHAILFGGYRERIAYNLGGNVFYNDLYLLDVSNPDLLKWTKVIPNSILPPERSYECGVYSPVADAIFIYGGLTYAAGFSQTFFVADSWIYHFSTNTWTLLNQDSPAGFRAGHSCALDQSGENVLITQGLPDNITRVNFYRDTWSWNFATNTWTNLTTSLPEPIGRWLAGWDRIPGTNNFLLFNGRRLTEVLYMTDVWEFNGDTKVWTEYAVSNVPNPPHEVFAFALTSPKWLLMAGGDADGNKTLNDTCMPPLQCRFIVTPTDKNFFLRLTRDQLTANWDDEAGFDHTITRHRHAVIVKMEPYLYLYGGQDFDGTHGIGDIYNTLTWGIKLPKKYWADK